MQDSTFVVISICAISLICAGLFGGVVFLVLRITGHSLREFLGGQSIPDAVDSMAGVEKPTSRNRIRTQTLPQTSDLRAQAKSLDFDSAVAHYRNNPSAPATPPIPFNPAAASQRTQPPPPLDDEPRPSDRRRRRRGARDEQEMDDMLGGFLDEGGDDILPF